VGVEGVSGRSEERGCEMTRLRCMMGGAVWVEHKAGCLQLRIRFGTV
jgi:hypothetical protein